MVKYLEGCLGGYLYKGYLAGSIIIYGQLLIDKGIIKANGRCILLCVGIINHIGAGPVQSTKAHGARFAAAIYRTSMQLVMAQCSAGISYSYHFGMCCRIAGIQYPIVPTAYNGTLPHYDAAKGAAMSGIYPRPGLFCCQVHKVSMLVCNFHFLQWLPWAYLLYSMCYSASFSFCTTVSISSLVLYLLKLNLTGT